MYVTPVSPKHLYKHKLVNFQVKILQKSLDYNEIKNKP